MKFDYFMAGLTIAVTAYVGKSFAIAPLTTTPRLLEVLSLAFLLVSAFAAIVRLETVTFSLLLNYKKLDSTDMANQLEQLAVRAPLASASDEEFWTQEELQQEVKQCLENKRLAERKLDLAENKGKSSYRLRNYSLFAGITLLVVSRVWASIVLIQ